MFPERNGKGVYRLTTKPKSQSLDILRLLAAFLVLGVHSGQVAGIDHITYVGQYGVQLFFILSGYLSEVSLSRDADPRRYYRRRALRILPLYWLTVALRWVFDLCWSFRGMPLFQRLAGPCGVGYLRYFVFLQMWLPSDSWALWNNRNTLWTMSAFAFFYLLAPWLHRALNSFARSFGALVFCIAAKGLLGKLLLKLLAGLPAAGNAGEFAAKTPLMVLYCFLLGTTLFHAIREEKQLIYGGFCLLLPALLGFQKFAWEGTFTALVLLAAVSYLVYGLAARPFERFIRRVFG